MREHEDINIRVVAHIDLDCFYVQVERSHNATLKDRPVAVVQYNPFGDLKSLAPNDNRVVNNGSLIAVSYEARAKGVKRTMRGAEARKVCPDIVLVQVPTSHGKADLTIYREASARIISVLSGSEVYKSCVVERASIDEVYVDVSADAAKILSTTSDEVLQLALNYLRTNPSPNIIAGEDSEEIRMSKAQIRNGHSGTGTAVLAVQENGQSYSPYSSMLDLLHSHALASTSNHHRSCFLEDAPPLVDSDSWFDRPFRVWSSEDKFLLCGAVVVQTLREEVHRQLGFTCSAGVAANKKLSKIASGMHKPNKQTLVPPAGVKALMQALPFSRVQGFGGKLGHTLTAEFGDRVKTLGDLLENVSKAELLKAFNADTVEWMLNTAAGVDIEPVLDRSLPISIGCSKSFRQSNMLFYPEHILDGSIFKWLHELAGELKDRVAADTAANSRVPRQLHLGLSVVARPTASALAAKQSAKSAVAVEDRVGDWFSEQGLSLSKVSQLTSAGCANAEAVAKAAVSMLQRAVAENDRLRPVLSSLAGLAITSLGLSVSSFSEIQTGSRSIKAFFEEHSSGGGVRSNAPSFPAPDPHSGGSSDQDHSRSETVDATIVTGDSLPSRDRDRVIGGSSSFQPQSLSDIDQSVLLSLPPSIQDEIRSALLSTSAGEKKRSPQPPDDGGETLRRTAAADTSGIIRPSCFSASSSSSSSSTPPQPPSSSSSVKCWGDIDKAVFESLPANIQQEIRDAMTKPAAGSTASRKTDRATSNSSRKKPKPAGEGIIKFCKRHVTN